MAKPRLLDLYCCEGGAGEGYARAGFEVVGVDKERQRRYPHEFHQADALEVLATWDLSSFAAVHASPPCQAYSVTKHSHGKEHPELVEPTRDLLVASGLPFIMENVPGAPLLNYVELCGASFGCEAIDDDGTPLVLRRHRLFESNIFIVAPPRVRLWRVPPTRLQRGRGLRRRLIRPQPCPGDPPWRLHARQGGAGVADRRGLDDPARPEPGDPAGVHGVAGRPADAAPRVRGGLVIRRLLARLLTGSDPDALRYARFATLMAAVLILASALVVLDITTSEPDRVQVTSTTVVTVTPATASDPVPAVIKEEPHDAG